MVNKELKEKFAVSSAIIIIGAGSVLHHGCEHRASEPETKISEKLTTQEVQEIKTPVLTRQEIEEAISLGKWNAKPNDFLSNVLVNYRVPPWNPYSEDIFFSMARIEDPSFSDFVFVLTPFFRLTYESARATREYDKINQNKLEEIIYSNIVSFGVTLHRYASPNRRMDGSMSPGYSIDFAKNIKAVVISDGYIFKPRVSITTPIAEIADEWKYRSVYRATNKYDFDCYNEIRYSKIDFKVISPIDEERSFIIDMGLIK